MTIAVQCKSVTKTYGAGTTAVVALRGIDLEVREGELLMIVGPSGSGKTTLISIISGILSQDGGQCLIFGNDLLALSDEEKTKYRGAHIGFVFQAFNLIPMLTSQENVAIPLILNGVPRDQALKSAAELLTRLGMEDKIDVPPLQLSGGQMQRVAIARAIIHNPQLIVCDEPTSALDHETGGKVLELLKSTVVGQKRALIVVTHDARIFPFADRIAKMDDGRIIA